MSDPIRVAARGFVVQANPAVGGCLTRFDVVRDAEATPILRTSPPGMSSPLEAACFPLVPFANRIRGGSFVCDGRTVTLPANMAGDKSPIHGQGWQSPWSVESRSESGAVLSFHHEADAWPWDYRAVETIVLSEEGLSLTLECENLSPEPMPCGLGFHPYWPCDGATRLRTAVTHAWTIDAEVLPVERVPASGRYDLADRLVCGQDLDNGFDGWGGEATILWPDRSVAVTMRSPDAPRFQLFSPPTGGIIAAEPVQNANCALNAPQASWPENGIEMLARGQSRRLRAEWRLG